MSVGDTEIDSDTGGRPALHKMPTGITGLDEITGGGLPVGRATLVCGAAGCGKTLLAMEFLVRGAMDHGEPGVFLAFEETAEELAANVASLGFDLNDLQARGLLSIDHIHLDPAEIAETGEYDLEGLFVRLSYAVSSVGAKRVAIDTVEVLFGALQDSSVIRSELRRLFRWLKDRDLTAVITAERGDDGRLTRFGIEEYVSDCVLTLDNRVTDGVSTRRLRILKYRGSEHGTNEYPFLIGDHGFLVLPITSVRLDYDAFQERVSSGIPRLDRMLGGGVYRGTSTLVSGSAGTGKTSIAAAFVDAACRRGERALYVSFEESAAQIVRNMASIGIRLGAWVDAGLLRFHNVRPTFYGLESHLAELQHAVDEWSPTVVAVDPMSALTHAGTIGDVTTALMREVDMLKDRGITALFTSLTHGAEREDSGLAVSSLIDTWLLLRNVETDGERNRLLFVIKSRGTAHSNQVREFVLSDDGINLLDVYIGPQGVLTGSARVNREAEEAAAAVRRKEEVDRRRLELARRRDAIESQVAQLWQDFEADSAELDRFATTQQAAEQRLAADRVLMARRRWADEAAEARDGKTADR